MFFSSLKNQDKGYYSLINNPTFNKLDYESLVSNPSIIDSMSDFFSCNFLFEVFYTPDSDIKLSSVKIQELVRSHSTYFESLQNSPLFNFFEPTNLVNFNINLLDNRFDFLNDYMLRVGTLSANKNIIDDVESLHPNLHHEITIFEALSYDMDGSLYAHLSMPFEKFFYPEPFIASPSFVHEELWFIHILHYQHWLWFMFISLIMFYFITFINVVRWCNPRNKPRRETRGVSRSKCADLITACVPVSWALSIIISESVDAADYYDGFGTGEIVVGIRAYQWGWEYFYPKGIDLNYNVSPSFSSLVGNSLKYNNSNLEHAESNGFWKHYQNKNSNKLSNTPAHLILTPSDQNNVLNFMNFDDVSLSTYKNSTSFKKIQYFSKVNPQSLYSLNSDLNNKFDRINNLFSNEASLFDTNNYKTFRQENFSTLKSNLNNSTTFIDNKSLNKFLDYNLSVDTNNTPSWDSISYKIHNKTKQNLNLNSNYAQLNSNSTNSELFQTSLTNYTTKTTYLASESDMKSNSNSLKYLLTDKDSGKHLISSSSINDSNSINDFVLNSDIYFFNTNLLNNNISYRFLNLKSPDQGILSSERNVRLLKDLNPTKFNPNFNYRNNNIEDSFGKSLSNSLQPAEINQYINSSNSWASENLLFKLQNNSSTFPLNKQPLFSNSTKVKPLAFNKFDTEGGELIHTLLQSKEESAPNHLFSNYWLTYWFNSSYQNTINQDLQDCNFSLNFYLPLFVKYSDYDFRNWQSVELLEDAFWESSFSAFSHEDYINSLLNAEEQTFFKKQEEIFDKTIRSSENISSKKLNLVGKPFFKNLNNPKLLYSTSLYNDDFITNPSFFKSFDFKTLADEVVLDSLEDSFDNFKNTLRFNNSNYLNTSLINNTTIVPLSYVQVMDSFRADFEDNGLNSDYNSNSLFEEHGINTGEDMRIFNPIKLRSTVRNSMVTFNSIQKVFKSRYDEGRSNARLQDLSNSYSTHPFLTEKRSNYESLLSKNSESFLNINFYNSKIRNINPLLSSLWNSTNIYYLDLPFLVSKFSDSSRYLWFDWQSRWSSFEVQPSSVARYSLSGVPYFSKNSDYSTGFGEELNDSENYLTRLTRARKNYISNWSYVPYFHTKNSTWFMNNFYNKHLYSSNSMNSLKLSLNNSSYLWNSLSNNPLLDQEYKPSFSTYNSPGRSFHKPISGLSNHRYTSNVLVDILSKREYLYRYLLSSKGLGVNLSDDLVASPKNPLLQEVMNTYALYDPINFSSEVTRDYLFTNNLFFVKFIVFRDLITSLNSYIEDSTINLTFLNNYLFFYMFGGKNTTTNKDLFKDQYRPMKKGVTNMIRLHTTGAIALPIEIRLHILASSKDVIHSWAIPSAGIKIDCVPGYSSHRIAIFLCSGIFWGQCMEICGRFHHWMPIVVYFMKRDLFFLWCTHFMHYTTLDNMFDMTDKQISDSLKLVSFDKYSWTNDL